jgi:dienelactone hydrolase
MVISGLGSLGALIATLLGLLVGHMAPATPAVSATPAAPAASAAVRPVPAASPAPASSACSAASAASPAPAASPAVRPAPARGPFAVGIRTLRFVDTSRTVRFPGHKPEARTLVTVIRYPALGPPSAVDRPGAPPASASGPFPLVIFGHGFAVTPGPYAALLQAWARAGYVVAAPIFPLGNANAPGGPNESDIVNQPRDMSFVISRMLGLSAGRQGLFAGLISRSEIAVAGQSDGGETALAVAYDRQFLDRRVRAAVILSGAEIPGVGGFDFPAPSPPLLASQGTADTTNLPFFTYQFFNLAPRPKFLLSLLGASHLPPYTTEQPQLGVVERVSIDFLNHYLKLVPGALGAMAAAGNVRGVAALTADP